MLPALVAPLGRPTSPAVLWTTVCPPRIVPNGIPWVLLLLLLLLPKWWLQRQTHRRAVRGRRGAGRHVGLEYQALEPLVVLLLDRNRVLEPPAVLLLRPVGLADRLLECGEFAPGALVELLQDTTGLEQVAAELDHFLLHLGPKREQGRPLRLELRPSLGEDLQEGSLRAVGQGTVGHIDPHDTPGQALSGVTEQVDCCSNFGIEGGQPLTQAWPHR